MSTNDPSVKPLGEIMAGLFRSRDKLQDILQRLGDLVVQGGGQLTLDIAEGGQVRSSDEAAICRLALDLETIGYSAEAREVIWHVVAPLGDRGGLRGPYHTHLQACAACFFLGRDHSREDLHAALNGGVQS